MKRPLRILVVDEHEVVRAGVRALLDREPDLKVVGDVASAEEALGMIGSARPDVVLLEHRLAGMSGAVACRELADVDPRIAVIGFTSFPEDAVILTFLSAKARGFLVKEMALPDLVAAIRAAGRGESVLAPGVVERVIEWARRARTLPLSEALSPSEVMTLSMIAQGMTNREIARRLAVSESSAKGYLRKAMKKLGASDRSQAVAAGIKQGVI
ncbi:MAG TPA: response regulator transcription factor [Actinomycetota bacterium]